MTIEVNSIFIPRIKNIAKTINPFITFNKSVLNTGISLFSLKMLFPILQAKRHKSILVKALVPIPLKRYKSWSSPEKIPMAADSL